MDWVLEAAVLLCVCKLACSLLFLPSLAASCSPVGLCCCCLLVFTDFLVTVFLSTSWILEWWWSEPAPLADVVALRFLLFLSHTYRAVLLLTTPLMAVETLVRLLCSDTLSPTDASDGRSCRLGEGETEEEAVEDVGGDGSSSHAVGYVCCLSVWVVVALNVWWRWKLEEVWAAACLHTTGSMIRCLPRLLGPLPSVGGPCWGLALLLLLLLFLLILFFVTPQRQHSPAERESCDSESKAERFWPPLAPSPVPPASFPPLTHEMLQPDCHVDPEKTESSCSVHRGAPPHHHGDSILISPACLSIKTERLQDSPPRSLWICPRPGLNEMTGALGLLSIFVLPLYLSVNILLIRTVETLLERCIQSFISRSARSRDAATSHHQTPV